MSKIWTKNVKRNPRICASDVHYLVEGILECDMLSCWWCMHIPPPVDHLNLFNDGCFQCSNVARVSLVDVVFEELPEEEIWGFRSGKWCAHFTSDLELMRWSSNFAWSNAMVTLAATFPSHTPWEKWSIGTILWDGSSHHAVFWLLRASNDSMRVLASRKHPVLGFSIAKIWMDSDRLTLELWWYSWMFGLFSEIQMVKNPLLYNLHKCHELLSSWSTSKFESCLEICWNWTSFFILLEQFWKNLVSSHERFSASSSKAWFGYIWLNISKC